MRIAAGSGKCGDQSDRLTNFQTGEFSAESKPDKRAGFWAKCFRCFRGSD
jgi:hypothetical protein